MSKDHFLKKLEMFQASSAPVHIKEAAIKDLKEKYFTQESKNKLLLSSIVESSSELKPEELF